MIGKPAPEPDLTVRWFPAFFGNRNLLILLFAFTVRVYSKNKHWDISIMFF